MTTSILHYGKVFLQCESPLDTDTRLREWRTSLEVVEKDRSCFLELLIMIMIIEIQRTMKPTITKGKRSTDSRSFAAYHSTRSQMPS